MTQVRPADGRTPIRRALGSTALLVALLLAVTIVSPLVGRPRDDDWWIFVGLFVLVFASVSLFRERRAAQQPSGAPTAGAGPA